MPIWPFRKRRRRSVSKDAAAQPLTEKGQPQPPPRAVTYPPPGQTQQPSSPSSAPPSRGRSDHARPASPNEKVPDPDTNADPPWVETVESEKEATSAEREKENVPPPSARRSSREDITALPMSRRLDHSPHLRAADMQRPPIPYNFSPYSASQSSVQRNEAMASPSPNVLRKRRSEYDSGTPQRRRSSRRRDDHLREEEIRAMSAQMPIPKRPGGFSDSPLRRDSKKMRGLTKDSNVSLPPAEESIRSMPSGILEQRGWEIGSIDVFNPRPAVRLSGIPQYVSHAHAFQASQVAPTIPEERTKEKEKRPETRATLKKRDTIGTRADDLDASELRMLLERDTKRRERRKKEQQEKLDRKLRSRAGRNRGDSDKKRREAEEERRAEEAKLRAEEENATRELMTPPTAIHPALRNRPEGDDREAVGLGIDSDDDAEAGATKNEKQLEGELEKPPENPFADPAAEQAPTPVSERLPAMPGAFTPLETPMEDVVVGTAQEVRLSQATTPPLSPVQGARGSSSLSQAVPRRTSEQSAAVPIPDSRRASEPDPKPERRAGAWASFFRRGGTNLKKPAEATPSEMSFSNTSRESMRNQPLPPHLIDTKVPLVSQTRRKSGTPVRTQSKFREDLPELPLSPPDSRLASPEVTTAAAAAAAARRGKQPTEAVDIPRQSSTEVYGRNDTPVSPSLRGHNMMSASLASVDSEGSWLASGNKRASTQSRLSQLGQRRQGSGSYEELGGDRDAEYVNRMQDSKRALHERKVSESALAGASPDEESELDTTERPETPGDPLTVHESVRRQPTLVHRDPRVKSREGLLTEYTGDPETPIPTSAGTGKGSLDFGEFDEDSPEPEIKRATSVDYGKGRGHGRQMSAGSAKLLDVPPRRPSAEVSSETSAKL